MELLRQSAQPAADNLSSILKRRAAELGFTLSGTCPAVTPAGRNRFLEWLDAGYAGEMSYLETRQEAYEHPDKLLSGARSLLVLGLPYSGPAPAKAEAGQGRVAAYALGRDYHDVIREKLHALCDFLREHSPGAQARGVVDTAPLAEREFAQLAGLGWVGKNTLLLNREEGSWFFLAVVVTDLELQYDEPHGLDHCGTCTACLDACPTDAFVAPYVLDARRCISYLTIEHRSAIPRDLREGMGDWVFGCDVCQDVCPWNEKHARDTARDDQRAVEPSLLDLVELFDLDEGAFRARFKGSPLWRPKRRGLLRNAAIVLGNRKTADALPALIRGLNDPEPLVRGACAWALGRYENPAASASLLQRRTSETEPDVQIEIDAALKFTSEVQATAQSASACSASASGDGCTPGKSSE